jgi:hypothetical protein
VCLNGLQNLFSARAVIRYSYGGDDRILPRIEVIDFSNRNIEPVAKPIFQTLDYVPLFL